MSNPQQLVQKLWNYCNILRDDGLSYGDYVEQLTYLLFLKMADEQSRPPFNKPSAVPKQYGWDALGKRIPINCFKENPSIKSSLKFLRRTPWARKKVEDLYLEFIAK